MARPKQHDDATGETLLDAAEELLATGGVDSVSVRKVAQAVGISTRAVYSVFGSKTGLLSALAVRGYRTLVDAVNAIEPTDDPAADLVTVAVCAFRPFAVGRPHLFRLTFERVLASVVRDAGVAEAVSLGYQALARWIRRAQDSGAIDARPEAEICFAFHALCQGLASCELSREPPPVGASFWVPVKDVDAESLWRSAVQAQVDGMKRR